MDFLAEDLSSLHEPRVEELKIWFEKNGQRFALPTRVSFHHLYFSTELRGENAYGDAASMLGKFLDEAGKSTETVNIADPFMFRDSYSEQSFGQIANIFGQRFAQSVLELKAGLWQGPVESGLGWHLVFVDSITPSRIPAFEEAEPKIRTDWLN